MNKPLKPPIVSLALVLVAVLVAATVLAAPAQEKERTISIRMDDGAWLGVHMTDLSRSMARALDLDDDDGVLVEEVVADSPAETAGLADGDVIIEIDGRDIADTADLSRVVQKANPGDEVEIVFLRDGDTYTVTAVLAEREKKAEKFIWHVGEDEDIRFGGDKLKNIFISRFSDRGFMGVTLQGLSPQLGEYFGVEDGEGALIESVNEDSPAAEAGLRAGDVIVEVAGEDIASAGNVTEALEDTEAGDEVDVIVLREGDRRTVTVTLGEAPENHFEFYGDAMEFRSLPQLEKLHEHTGDLPHNIRIFRDHDEDFDIDLDDDLDELHEEIENLRQEMKKLKKELREIDE